MYENVRNDYTTEYNINFFLSVRWKRIANINMIRMI